jgi:hypothetical protein
LTQAQSGEEFHARECALRNVQGALIFVAFCALESFIVWREVDRAVRGNTLIDVLRDVAVITVCAKLLLMYKCFRERFVAAIVILRYAIGAGGPSFGFEFPGRVAQPLGLNFRVAAPSWFFEGAEGLLFPSDCRRIS